MLGQSQECRLAMVKRPGKRPGHECGQRCGDERAWAERGEIVPSLGKQEFPVKTGLENRDSARPVNDPWPLSLAWGSDSREFSPFSSSNPSEMPMDRKAYLTRKLYRTR